MCDRIHAQEKTYPSKFVVAKDGSGDFTTIQQAVNAVRDLSQQQVTIYIKKGIYHEKVTVPSWKTHISFIGENKDSTIITNDDHTGKQRSDTDAFGNTIFNTFTSYTVLVQGNDFKANNLTIQNTAGATGQAVALHVEADRVVITNCKLLGWQDTLYAAKDGTRQYYKSCFIEGCTDFIFGEAIAVFDSCIIKGLCNSFITAAATPQDQLFGFVFRHCSIIADSSTHTLFLGRPWRPYAKTVFMYCNLNGVVKPEGWNNWRDSTREKTALYAEYKNKGTDVSNRVAWSKQLNDGGAKQYTLQHIFSTQNDKTPTTCWFDKQ